MTLDDENGGCDWGMRLGDELGWGWMGLDEVGWGWMGLGGLSRAHDESHPDLKSISFQVSPLGKAKQTRRS